MSKQKVIDGNMHYLPTDLFSNEKVMQGFLDCAPFTFGIKAYRAKTPDGKRDQLVLADRDGNEILNYVDGDYSLEAKLSAMDEAGVDVAILRMPVWQEWLPLDMCKYVNDGAAEMCKRSGGRLYANAVLPPWGRKEDIYELERCIGELGMVGVQFAACYGDLFLDNEIFRPYLKVLNEKKVPAVIHHTPGQNCYANYSEYTVLRRELGRLMVQATAVGREIYSGMFDTFPNLVFIHTMLGGNWFGNQQILAPHRAAKKEAMNRLATNVDREAYDRYMKDNLYFDACHAMSWGSNAVECAVKQHGADHILLGSSFPVFYEWLARSVESINALDVSQEEKDLILGGNAQRIFKIQ
ncbi:MAG: amidohydrolase [Coriobacteriaceae bacterium]|jgi:predicted TIM-barrel fold metal-dependent hydrolase|nr:amidohydrolase [Coriobacteriaceae bacterium]